jgi:hypothetical protein
MDITQIGLVMLFGALVAAAGLALLFLRKEQAENVFKIGGQEFKISTPALAVLLVGVFVFILPLILQMQNQTVISFQWPWPGRGSEPTITGSGPTMPVKKEHEPNDQITTANLITMSTTISGMVDGKEDRDFFKFKTGQNPNTRVILRKTASGGFDASVIIYDNLENRVADGSTAGRQEDSISFVFRAHPNSYYYAKVEAAYGSDGGPYELLIKEE